MKYHEEVIKLRLKEKRDPLALFIDDCRYADNEYLEVFNDPTTMPSINIAGDFIEGLDLRFVFNLIVHGACSDEKRAKALFKRCMQFGPKMLAVGVVPNGTLRYGEYWIGVYTKEKGVICE